MKFYAVYNVYYSINHRLLYHQWWRTASHNRFWG